MADFVFNPFREDNDVTVDGTLQKVSPRESFPLDTPSDPDSSIDSGTSEEDDVQLFNLLGSAVRAQSMVRHTACTPIWLLTRQPSLEDRLARLMIPASKDLPRQSSLGPPAAGGKQAEISHVASFWNDPPVAEEVDKKKADQTLAKVKLEDAGRAHFLDRSKASCRFA